MTNSGNQPASRATVASYLLDAYDVAPEAVARAVETESGKADLDDAIRFGSYAFYVSEKIAAREGWPVNPDYDPDDDDDDDEEE